MLRWCLSFKASLVCPATDFKSRRKNPIGEFAYDGTSTHPYETMFVVMDTVAIENGWSFAKLAALYETWLMLQVMTICGFVGIAAA